TNRRREVRRTVPRPGPAWLAFMRRRDVAWAALFITTFTVFGGALVVYLGQQPRYYVGQVVTEPIVARFAFQHEDEQATFRAKERARQAQPPIFVANQTFYDNIRKRLSNLIALADYKQISDVPEEYREQVPLTQDALDELRSYFEGG